MSAAIPTATNVSESAVITAVGIRWGIATIGNLLVLTESNISSSFNSAPYRSMALDQVAL
jgi:hypothetical protein